MSVRLVTTTGSIRLVWVPSPNWPSSLVPHAQTVPSESRAREWNRPAATARTFDRPGIWRGVETDGPVFLTPSCPAVLLPQPQSVPSDRIARLKSDPAEMDTMPDGVPA